MADDDDLDDLTDEQITSDEKLDQDYDPPFSEPDVQADQIAPDHPSTDSNIDEQELYDEGLADASSDLHTTSESDEITGEILG